MRKSCRVGGASADFAIRSVRPAAFAVLGLLSVIARWSATASGSAGALASWDPAHRLLIDGAAVVTMNDEHAVIPRGRVLVPVSATAGTANNDAQDP